MPKKCPDCGNDLSIIVRGFPCSDIIDDLKAKEIKYKLGGCMRFGDDRDGAYYCSRCDQEYSNDLKPIILKNCPLVPHGAVFKDECKKYEEIARQYGEMLNDKDKICEMICPNLGRPIKITLKNGEVIAGIITRSMAANPRCSEDILLVQCGVTLNSFEDVFIKDIVSIE